MDDEAPSIGRPSPFRPEFVEQGRKLGLLGATDADVADFFEVSVRTIHRWKIAHSGFAEALALGKRAADDRVERSLYHRAIGYSHDAVKMHNVDGEIVITPYTEHYPPDTAAGIFWLKNRRKDEWRDKVEHEHSGGLTVTIGGAEADL